MPLDLSVITDDSVGDHMNTAETPIIGAEVLASDLVGVPLSSAPQGVCGILKWMEANTSRSIELQLTFRSDGSRWKVVVTNPLNGNVVKTLGDRAITGKRVSDIGFAELHERLGYRLLARIARTIATQLNL